MKGKKGENKKKETMATNPTNPTNTTRCAPEEFKFAKKKKKKKKKNTPAGFVDSDSVAWSRGRGRGTAYAPETRPSSRRPGSHQSRTQKGRALSGGRSVVEGPSGPVRLVAQARASPGRGRRPPPSSPPTRPVAKGNKKQCGSTVQGLACCGVVRDTTRGDDRGMGKKTAATIEHPTHTSPPNPTKHAGNGRGWQGGTRIGLVRRNGKKKKKTREKKKSAPQGKIFPPRL